MASKNGKSSSRPFDPKPGDALDLFGQRYTVQPHPQVPHIAFTATAGRADVHQLRDHTGQYFALKVFKKKYRTPELSSTVDKLECIKSCAGLSAARRQVVLPSQGAARKHRNLQYAILMPWIQGKTWFDMLNNAQTQGHALRRSVAVQLCHRFLEVMEALEQKGMAHTDISPGNVMVEFNPVDVQLLDLEDMFVPGWPPPAQVHEGSPGYRHRSGQVTWKAEGDRYAAAVLAAEMMVLAKSDLAQWATDEGYFTAHDGTPEGRARFQQARPWLKKVAPEFATTFEGFWFADSLDVCPKISELRRPIERLLANGVSHERPRESPISAPGVYVASSDVVEWVQRDDAAGSSGDEVEAAIHSLGGSRPKRNGGFGSPPGQPRPKRSRSSPHLSNTGKSTVKWEGAPAPEPPDQSESQPEDGHQTRWGHKVAFIVIVIGLLLSVLLIIAVAHHPTPSSNQGPPVPAKKAK